MTKVQNRGGVVTSDREVRIFRTLEMRIQKRADGTPVLVGHSAVYNELSEEMWGFREKILPGFFSDVLGDDVRCLFNHNPDNVLGRTVAKTCRLFDDSRGLRFECDLPGTTVAKNLEESIARGDVSQCSFSFTTKEDRWTFKQDEPDLRELVKCERLYDVGPVTFPAYPQTDVAVRSVLAARDEARAKSAPVDRPLLRSARLAIAAAEL